MELTAFGALDPLVAGAALKFLWMVGCSVGFVFWFE